MGFWRDNYTIESGDPSELSLQNRVTATYFHFNSGTRPFIFLQNPLFDFI